MAHYAHDVQYEAENFIDKNKDTVPDEHLSLLNFSEFEFLRQVLDKAATANPAPTVRAYQYVNVFETYVGSYSLKSQSA